LKIKYSKRDKGKGLKWRNLLLFFGKNIQQICTFSILCFTSLKTQNFIKSKSLQFNIKSKIISCWSIQLIGEVGLLCKDERWRLVCSVEKRVSWICVFYYNRCLMDEVLNNMFGFSLMTLYFSLKWSYYFLLLMDWIIFNHFMLHWNLSWANILVAIVWIFFDNVLRWNFNWDTL
jgi:hypothetical protein